ncbi:MAG: response regulator [Candidatus Marinimicrobia bacterium]|nr:response regulator [Candidatus Neomarinimicrobiota bacterium]
MNGDKKILIVDDDATNLAIMSKIFNDAGHQTFAAQNSGEAYQFIEKNQPDLVLLDVVLSNESGMDILKKIKSQKRYNKNYIVLISGKLISPDDLATGLDLGADGYLTRPIQKVELLARVNSHLRAAKARSELIQQVNKSLRIIETITHTTPGLTYIYDYKQNKIDYINFENDRIFGFTSQEFRQFSMKNIIDLVHPEEVSGLLEHEEKLKKMPEGDVCIGEFRINDKQGKRHTVQVFDSPLTRNEEGVLVQKVGFVLDVCHQKHTEKELSKLSAVVRQSTSSIVITDVSGTIEYVNPKFSNMTGYRSEEVIGRNLSDFQKSDSSENDTNEFWKPLNSKNEWRGKIKSQKKNGDYFWEDVNFFPLTDNIGKKTHFIKISDDITQKLDLEREKEKLQKQIIQAQKMESIGLLAGGIAHDFNNMLTVIIGYAEMLENKSGTNKTVLELAKEIKEAGLRSADLTKQLLTFARKQDVRLQVLDINELIENLLKMLKRLIGEEIELSWHPGHDIWKIEMDPSQINQVLANLCVNARDAIKGSGTIKIETGNRIVSPDDCLDHPGLHSGDYIHLAVSDTGCGMDKITLNHIFEPFFTTKKEGEGTGLGLSTIYGIIKQNNGYIDIISEPSVGSTFHIYIPRYRGNKPTFIDEQIRKQTLKAFGTILLVEDELSILKMTTRILNELGYHVLPVNSPEKAIEIAKNYSQNINLLMTDVIMPGMNGKQLSEKLLTIYPNIKQLFMSAYTTNIIIKQGGIDSNVNFLQKPFTILELEEILEKIFADN